jgi:hypothetical protein
VNLRGYILGTVAANLALVAALLWQAARMPAPAPRGGVSITTNVVTEVLAETSPRPAVVSVPAAPFRWEQLESANHLQFLTNLLAIGCPPETARDILEARVADEFRARLRELLRQLQARFWDTAAVDEDKLEKLFQAPELEEPIELLKAERKRITAELQATLGPGPAKPRDIGRFENFQHVSPEKLAALREQTLKQMEAGKLLEAELTAAKADRATRDAKLREHRELHSAARRALFTDAEWAESELRGSSEARGVRELRGYSASPGELRALAVSLREFAAANPVPRASSPTPVPTPELINSREKWSAARNQFLTARLGNAGFAAFERGSDPRFHTLLKLAQRLEQPTETAAHWLALQTAALNQARQIREHAALTPEARAAALQAIRAETERALQSAVGARGWGAYQRHAAGWFEELAQ